MKTNFVLKVGTDGKIYPPDGWMEAASHSTVRVGWLYAIIDRKDINFRVCYAEESGAPKVNVGEFRSHNKNATILRPRGCVWAPITNLTDKVEDGDLVIEASDKQVDYNVAQFYPNKTSTFNDGGYITVDTWAEMGKTAKQVLVITGGYGIRRNLGYIINQPVQPIKIANAMREVQVIPLP